VELDFAFERFFLVCIVADYSCRIGCVSRIVAVTGIGAIPEVRSLPSIEKIDKLANRIVISVALCQARLEIFVHAQIFVKNRSVHVSSLVSAAGSRFQQSFSLHDFEKSLKCLQSLLIDAV
jgi:hypothetical protein